MSRAWTRLWRVNPVAKLIATLPLAAALFVTRGTFVPATVIAVTLLAIVCFGAIGWRRAVAVAAGMLAVAGVGTVLLGLWVHPGESATLWQAGPFALSETGLSTGAATTLRLLAIIALMLLSGLTTTPRDLLLSVQQQLRVPYRYVYAARTALVIAPFMVENLRTITLAHKVRGTVAGRGPLGWVRRQAAYALPLMTGGIRHGERLAIAMETRAFGAGPRRTERRVLRWRPTDTLFVLTGWLLTAGIYGIAWTNGLLGSFSLW